HGYERRRVSLGERAPERPGRRDGFDDRARVGPPCPFGRTEDGHTGTAVARRGHEGDRDGSSAEGPPPGRGAGRRRVEQLAFLLAGRAGQAIRGARPRGGARRPGRTRGRGLATVDRPGAPPERADAPDGRDDVRLVPCWRPRRGGGLPGPGVSGPMT